MDKKKLYESIMKQVSIEVKKAINEQDDPFVTGVAVPGAKGEKAAKDLVKFLSSLFNNKNIDRNEINDIWDQLVFAMSQGYETRYFYLTLKDYLNRYRAYRDGI